MTASRSHHSTEDVAHSYADIFHFEQMGDYMSYYLTNNVFLQMPFEGGNSRRNECGKNSVYQVHELLRDFRRGG